MSALDRDMRYALAPLAVRGAYALLFNARREIAEATRFGFEPLRIAARVLGVDAADAALELDRLRSAGLVGDGLALLAGVRGIRRAAVETEDASGADVAAVRAALASHEGSRRALAREIGCSESALRQFANGGRALGPGHLASLAETLGLRSSNCAVTVRSNDCAVEVRSTHVTAQPTAQATAQDELRTATAHLTAQSTAHGFPLSDSLSSSSPHSSSSEVSLPKENEDCVAAGGSLREGAQSELRSDCAVASETTAQSATVDLAGEKSKPRRERRARTTPAPAVDPVPLEGTVARRVYEAITTDLSLAPIVRGPGDLAMRLAAICDGTPIDPAAEVISIGAWHLRAAKKWRDGAAGLLRNIQRKVAESKALPVAAPAVTGLTRDVSRGPLKSAELDQFDDDYTPDFSEPRAIGGGR